MKLVCPNDPKGHEVWWSLPRVGDPCYECETPIVAAPALPIGGVMRDGNIELAGDWEKSITPRKGKWPTVTAQTGRQGPGRQGREGGANLQTALKEAGHTGPVNPSWAEWLMGFPANWTRKEVI